MYGMYNSGFRTYYVSETEKRVDADRTPRCRCTGVHPRPCLSPNTSGIFHLSTPSPCLFIYFIQQQRGQSQQSFAVLMSNSGSSPSTDLAGQSGFEVAGVEPRCLADILMGKLASLIWPADVVCHWVSITCHSALMPLDRPDQSASFDLRGLLKWWSERD